MPQDDQARAEAHLQAMWGAVAYALLEDDADGARRIAREVETWLRDHAQCELLPRDRHATWQRRFRRIADADADRLTALRDGFRRGDFDSGTSWPFTQAPSPAGFSVDAVTLRAEHTVIAWSIPRELPHDELWQMMIDDDRFGVRDDLDTTYACDGIATGPPDPRDTAHSPLTTLEARLLPTIPDAATTLWVRYSDDEVRLKRREPDTHPE